MSTSAPPRGWYPKRGEVYWAWIDKKRPCVVLSVDQINRFRVDICVVPFTGMEHKRFGLRVYVDARESGLAEDSWAKCDQITTIAKKNLYYPPRGSLAESALVQIENSVGVALGLMQFNGNIFPNA